MFFPWKKEERCLYFEQVRNIGWVILKKFGIKIRKRGNIFSSRTGDYITLCPFHAEKSPSMHFYDNSGHYHCYGCGRHGDVFDFVYRILGDKIKAYHWIKKNYGIPLPWEKLK